MQADNKIKKDKFMFDEKDEIHSIPEYNNKRSDKKKPSVKNSQLEENREKIKESLNMQKKNSMQMALNSTNDFSYYENSVKTDSLFDKVLTQVKERNKGKIFFILNF